MDVEINYCNNIDNACITLSENKLNIKFAPNGTGKSTDLPPRLDTTLS